MSARRQVASAALLVLVVLGCQHPATADEREWRLSAEGFAGAVFAKVDGASGWGINPGGRLRVHYGLSDYIELGLASSFAWAPNIIFPNATVQMQPGDLRADLLGIEFAGAIRFIADLPIGRKFFARNHPFLEVRGGGLVSILKSSQLLDSSGDIVLNVPSESTIHPYVAAEIGLEHRFGASWILGFDADYEYAGSTYQAVTVGIAVGWMSY